MKAEDTILKIENITKTFGDFTAIDNVSLDIPRGSFTTLLGPSGCGKTTLMRMIAGFFEPDHGNIMVNGKIINGVPAFKRNTPLVFQDYALFPHMSVYENISYGLKLKKIPRKEINEKVESMIEMFGLQGLAERSPKELSGGQQQRVAFARALITGQEILLMDEPLSNLDAKMRVEVRNELRELQQKSGITALFVTHDQDEALSMSDWIAVFDKGVVAQFGTPWDVYFKPNSRFVTDFVGESNFIEGEVVEVDGEDILVKCMDESILRVHRRDRHFDVGAWVTMVVRPECMTILYGEDTAHNHENVWSVTINRSSFLGRMIRYWVNAGPMEWIIDDSSPSLRGYLSGKITVAIDKKKIHILPDEN